jgi:hypothetical protein
LFVESRFFVVWQCPPANRKAARFLLKVGFGVKYAEESLSAGLQGREADVRKRLGK